MQTDDTRLAAIKAEYTPYHTFPEFEEGFAAHEKRQYRNPYPSSVAAQAWDRGLAAAARHARGDNPVKDPDGSGLSWLLKYLAQSKL